MVEEDEWPDHAPFDARQYAADSEAGAQFVRAALDQEIDRIGHIASP
jgi:hypothetical protein